MLSSAPSTASGGARGGIPAVDPRHDGRFRTLTARGNDAFGAGAHAEAGRLYRKALTEAERLLHLAAESGDAILIAPMALVVAAQNLAVAESQAGRVQAANALSERIIERLIETAASPASPMALRLNCLRHLRHALAFLADSDGDAVFPSATLSRLRERVADVGAEVIRVAEMWRGAKPAGSPSPRPDA